MQAVLGREALPGDSRIVIYIRNIILITEVPQLLVEYGHIVI